MILGLSKIKGKTRAMDKARLTKSCLSCAYRDRSRQQIQASSFSLAHALVHRAALTTGYLLGRVLMQVLVQQLRPDTPFATSFEEATGRVALGVPVLALVLAPALESMLRMVRMVRLHMAREPAGLMRNQEQRTGQLPLAVHLPSALTATRSLVAAA